jgi:hypothetical protein
MAKRECEYDDFDQYFEEYFKVDYNVWYPYGTAHLLSPNVSKDNLDKEQEHQVGILYFHKVSNRPLMIIKSYEDNKGENCKRKKGRNNGHKNVIQPVKPIFFIYARPCELDLDSTGLNALTTCPHININEREYNYDVLAKLDFIDKKYSDGPIIERYNMDKVLLLFLKTHFATLKFDLILSEEEEEDEDDDEEYHQNEQEESNTGQYKKQRL